MTTIEQTTRNLRKHILGSALLLGAASGFFCTKNSSADGVEIGTARTAELRSGVRVAVPAEWRVRVVGDIARMSAPPPPEAMGERGEVRWNGGSEANSSSVLVTGLQNADSIAAAQAHFDFIHHGAKLEHLELPGVTATLAEVAPAKKGGAYWMHAVVTNPEATKGATFSAHIKSQEHWSDVMKSLQSTQFLARMIE